jgi:hypothetical protein
MGGECSKRSQAIAPAARADDFCRARLPASFEDATVRDGGSTVSSDVPTLGISLVARVWINALASLAAHHTRGGESRYQVRADGTEIAHADVYSSGAQTHCPLAKGDL